ncbi:hypothetical protein [Dehalogenimonas etheniformans]|uniref:Uncharacterized protein n=1 Tax=Dehalogenimonas etheniformans TaxID=1536648 RepID=A0A2P5P4Z4_9CHLR|nr:hypothetical protein [Dehalogenimonas etheniformans]PPD57369.1 hypothetical protein JP09_010035 [Dehalogenimonas etheniformans]QNT75219.1 hypothetical protein HX448_00180 [Dehalogenimonas etheniformans]
MAAQTLEKQVKRLKLLVVGSPVDKTFQGQNGAVPKVEFTAVMAGVQSRPQSPFECTAKALFEHIKDGAELDADVEFSKFVTAGGQEYPHRKVIQLYDDGQPVKDGSKGKGGWARGSSPEERASIELQSFAKIAADMILNGFIPPTDPITNDLKTIIAGKLKAGAGLVKAQNCVQITGK